MTSDLSSENDDSLLFTTDIVAAYVSNNSVSPDQLNTLIKDVHQTIKAIASSNSSLTADQAPAVSVKKSVTPDHIICLEDGKKLKMLKRYLRTQYGLSPEEYRRKWDLPSDYPMVAPNYAKRRSQFAKDIGLGKAADAPKTTVSKKRGRAKSSA